MKPQIITISGLPHSGKNTSADYLVSKFDQLGIKAVKIGFKDRMRLLLEKLKELYLEMDIPSEEFRDLNRNSLDPWFKSSVAMSIFVKVGGDLFKYMTLGNMWYDYVSKNPDKFDEYQVIIISDWIFSDKIEHFKQLNSRQLLSIRVDRPSSEEKQIHDIETHVNSIPVNLVIDNSGTIENLKYELDSLIDSICRVDGLIRD